MRRISLCSLAVLLAGGVQANQVELLYAPVPPADAAYVRVVNLAGQAVRVEGLTEQPLELGTGGGDRSSRYELVGGRSAVRLRIESATAAMHFELPIVERHFFTVALPEGGQPIVVDEVPGDFNQMKAQLAFFALAPGCRSASLRLAGTEGVRVFSGVAFATVGRRAVNAVAAEVQVRCDMPQGAAGESFALEGIGPGRRVSVFLFGEPASPQTAWVVDQTALPGR